MEFFKDAKKCYHVQAYYELASLYVKHYSYGSSYYVLVYNITNSTSVHSASKWIYRSVNNRTVKMTFYLLITILSQ